MKSQYAHNVVLTYIWRRFNVKDVVQMTKRRRVLTGIFTKQYNSKQLIIAKNCFNKLFQKMTFYAQNYFY